MQKYIDLGWHTVPLKGQLKRLPNSSEKTIPKFSTDWREKYQVKFNKLATPIGGAITGEVSGIIAIDCDCPTSFQLFRSLDPSYEFVFHSKGKDNCGTIIYKYTSNHPTNFKVHNDNLSLDFYSNNGFIYLATDANETKYPLAEPLPELKDVPPLVSALLTQLTPEEPKEVVTKHLSTITAPCLAPLVERYNKDKGKFSPGLFKIITPISFRDLPAYVSSGTLHPNEVPNGRGSEYLSKVSAILGADVSIDKNLYSEAMHYINGLFDDPMDADRLDATVLDPMLRGKSTIDGKVIWAYDEAWEQTRLVISTKKQTSADICMDDIRGVYYAVDEANQSYKSFNRDTELISYIGSVSHCQLKKPEIISRLSLVNTASLPHKAFGFHSLDDPTARTFNTFVQTPELYVFSNPSAYSTYYKEPTATLKYFHSLVPEDKMRDYLFSFLHRKFLTFDYSPAVLYFLGAHGSGKDTFVHILDKIIGKVAKPSAKEFLEKHNGWIADNYFAQLDEYGNSLSRISEKEEALGRLKAYTGKQDIQIRQMRSDGYMYKHNITFIMTANKNPLMLEDGDRRIALFNTPNVLADEEWVNDMGGVSEAFNAIMRETKDFMYWLKTQTRPLDSTAYMKPLESESKHELVASSMFAAQRIAYSFKHGLKKHIMEIADNFALDVDKFSGSKVWATDLEDLYMELTEQNGDMRSLNKFMKNNNCEIQYTTREGNKLGYFSYK